MGMDWAIFCRAGALKSSDVSTGGVLTMASRLKARMSMVVEPMPLMSTRQGYCPAVRG